jgi:hypothetical protein
MLGFGELTRPKRRGNAQYPPSLSSGPTAGIEAQA